jgi:hypothetical protein
MKMLLIISKVEEFSPKCSEMANSIFERLHYVNVFPQFIDEENHNMLLFYRSFQNEAK